MSKCSAAAAALVAAVVLVVGAGTASAAFPGANGKLAFVKDGDVWVAEADGSDPVRLTTDPAIDRSPRWSPDGTQIAFSSDRDGDFELFVMNADGSGQRQVTFNAGAQDRIPGWTGDGSQLVYDKNFAEIHAVDADGSGVERKLADGFVPGTAPRGDTVVFGHDGLVTMQIDGKARRQVTDDAADFGANWSPQGNELVFTRSTETDRDVYRVQSNGAGLTRWTNTPDRFEFAPVWSPDGERIAFVGCTGATCQLFVSNADGSGEKQVTTFGVSGGEGAIDWQPVREGPQDVVIGSGTATFADFPAPGEGVTEQFIVSAHSGPLGEDPHGQITFHSPLLESQQAKANVTCMVVTGNRARVGGVFDEPVVYMGLTFRWFELIVEDNGPPGQGTDTTTSFIFFDRPRPPDFSPCNFDAPTEFAVEQGNFTVKDAVGGGAG